MKREENKAYVFQGNTIIVPHDSNDSEIQEQISFDLIEKAFEKTPLLLQADSFPVPHLNGEEAVRFITLPEGELPSGWKAVPLRQALAIISGGTMAGSNGPAGRILRSYHISLWRAESRYCGRCGALNGDSVSGELARQCTSCGRLEFPRISPAVIFLITNDRGEALLAHNKNFISGTYSLIAGFNEAGESLEDTVAREAKEEVNIEVDQIRYVLSQPWPFPNSLMLGFTARYSGGELKPDGVEIEDARWFARDALPNLPGSASISRYLINRWIEGKL